MALHQDTIWEVRTGGNNENGGGFHDRIPGTSVDYSFQNAPQLDLTDLACLAGSITITSVVGGFTQAMVGNIIRFHAGANFTVGFYEIVTWNSGNSVDLDRIPVTGVGTNGHGKVGGGQVNCDLIGTVVVPGNTVYIENGVYAAHPAVTFNAAYTVLLPLTIWGYNGARNTRPTGANRPTIQMGANTFSFGQFAKIRNISFEGSGASVVSYSLFSTSASAFMENCKIVNLAVAGTVSCLLVTPGAHFVTIICIDCEFKGTGGATSTGISNIRYTNVLNCYFHNLSYGIGTPTIVLALFSIFANIGINGVVNGAQARIINCTFEGIGGNGIIGGLSVAVNNTFSNCVTAGINGSAALLMNNNFFSCGTPWIGGTLNPVDNNTFVAPQFVTPGSNYALQRTSGLIDRAFSMRLGV